MAKNRKKRSIRSNLAYSFIIPATILIENFLGSAIFVVSYVLTANRAFLITAIVYALVFIVIYLVSSLIIFRKIQKIYYDGLYRTTSSLLRSFKNNIPTENSYPDENIAELEMLNEDLNDVNTVIANSTLISSDLDSAYIPLNFISNELRIVTLDSFKKELRSLIYCSQNYKNVIVEAFYDLDEDVLNSDEASRLVNILSKSFEDYKHFIFAPNNNGTGYYLFLPRTDSFSHISEILNTAMKELSISKKTFDGLMTLNVRFSIVCYPYSNIDELFPDLLYAKRQGKVINLYLPNRLTTLSENMILQNSLNLNNMSRVLDSLTNLKISTREKDHNNKIIRQTISSLVTYLDLDYAGIILFDEVNNSYFSNIHIHKGKEELFKENSEVTKDFIEALDIAKDEDNSLYFSSYKHAGYVLEKFLDKINVSGGFYYLIHDQERVIGVIYFFNSVREFNIDSYIRETMYILCYRIGDFLTVNHEQEKVMETYGEINNLLMSSDYSLYRINRHTFELVGFSSHFSTIFPSAKFGEKCYKALYGLDYQCPNCPLKTSKKMISEIKGGQIETSLTLNNKKSRLIRLLVKKEDNQEEIADRFDKDLLINSFRSLKISLDNNYAINSRGYLLVLRIDNLDILVKEAGSEGYLYLLRQFINRIKELKVSNSNIFYYSTQALAILLPEVGQIDLVNFIEKIYDVSKESYEFNGTQYSFNITYLPYTYPQQYPTSDDFLKYVLRHFNAVDFEINKDKIVFPDNDYVRSASRNEFMLSVIDDQFGNKTFSVALQPFVKAGDKSIFGAELLIRLSDNYRNSVFNADELIKVAGKNGKISLISNALINYIGELYKQHGLTTFKISGFQRLTINTDFSFFNDPTFFQTLFDTFNLYSFQRNFLGFEITEREVYQHLGEFKKIAKGILNHHIVLICDQYSGEFLSMDVLKEMGFSEVKVGRYLVGDIEVNPQHLNEITSLDKLANENGMKITFVGVENADQYILIRDMDKNCMCQGYHFYRPLEDYRLIDELRKNK